MYIGSLEVSASKKFVITGSSYGALKQMAHEKLGARSYKIELFPLSFEEYLYFSGKISRYGEDYTPTEQDIKDFYRMRNLPPGMDFVIDRNYMLDTFTDIETSRANQLYAERDVFLTREQYISLLDIIAYTLNDRISISQSLIGLANKIVNKMSTDIRSDIGIQDLIHIIRYLYHSGFLFVDLKTNENEKQNSDRIMHELGLTRTFADLEQLSKKYTFIYITASAIQKPC